MKRLLRWTVVVLLALGGVFVAGSWIAARHLTGPHPRPVGAPPSDFPYPIETVAFPTSDAESISGWLVRAGKSDKGIVLLHGYSGSRAQMLRRARFFADMGFTCLLYDARACGESSGAEITFGYRERHDLIAAVKLLQERGCQEIACLGVSQGGATILFAADDLPGLKCAICESVFDNMEHAVDRRLRHYTGAPGWLGRACSSRSPSSASIFPSMTSAPSITSPGCAARSSSSAANPMRKPGLKTPAGFSTPPMSPKNCG